MRHFLFLLLPLLVGGSNLRAQGPLATQWQTRSGVRAGRATEYCHATTYTRHHRVVCVGDWNSTNYDHTSALWMFSARGDSLQTVYYNYPIPGGGTDGYSVRNVVEASNGDFLLAGIGVLLRTDSLGRLRWVRPFTTSRIITPFDIEAVPDGGALIVCTVQHPLGTSLNPVSVPTVVRVDSAGTPRWQRTYGQPYYNPAAIIPLSDGSYALAGSVGTGPPQWQGGAWVQRLDLDGNALRSRNLIPATNFVDLSEGPRGGLVLCGNNAQGAVVAMADSLDQLQWQQTVFPTRVNTPTNAIFTFVRALAQPGRVLVAGQRPIPRPTPTSNRDDYFAQWQAPAAPGGAPTAVWEQQFSLGAGAYFNTLAPAGPGSLVAGGGYNDVPNRQYDLLTSRLNNLPALYEPPLCRTPPYASFGLVFDPATRLMRFYNLTAPGPPYAQLVRWRWDFGDGSPPYFGPFPPPHVYPAGAGPATPVRLTVTNNLGCTASEVQFPLATATAAVRVLQANLGLFPNPAEGGTATLTLPGLRPQPPVPGEVLNAVGQVVLRLALAPAALAQGLALDLAALPPGVYALRLHPQEGPVGTRLVRR